MLSWKESKKSPGHFPDVGTEKGEMASQYTRSAGEAAGDHGLNTDLTC